MKNLTDSLESAKQKVVSGIVDSGFKSPKGDIPQTEIARNVDISAKRFTGAINELIREKVLGYPEYDPQSGIYHNFNEREARGRGYL